VVGELRRIGARAEASSPGEIDAALDGGLAPAEVLLTAPGKSTAVLDHALARGVRRFSVDSPTDLDRVDAAAHRHGVAASCLLRVNADEPVPGMGLAMTGTPSQFGADASWVASSPELFRDRPSARITGLHLYMGTNLTDEDALLSQFDVAARIAGRLAPLLGDVTEIDLGGGFGCPYARAGDRPVWPGLRAGIERLLGEHLPRWRGRGRRIAFESGRYLAGDSGVLVSRVLDVKVSKGETFVVLDAGINHLGGMVGLRRLPPIVPTVLPFTDPATGPETRTTVVGPLCTPLDTLVRGTRLPAMRPGQLVAVPNVGAYGLTASLLAFLGHRAPAEVVRDGRTVLTASRLEISRTSLDHRVDGPADRLAEPVHAS
jgi:diaminopimelate decarboxylase